MKKKGYSREAIKFAVGFAFFGLDKIGKKNKAD